MGRPHKERRVTQLPSITHFKPVGIPLRELGEIILKIEEMEAIRLADIEHLEQAEAAKQMEVSPPTFNRILLNAHKKIATALWQGYAIRIEGGTFRIDCCKHKGQRHLKCSACGYSWTLAYGTGQRCYELACPICQSRQIIREQ